MFHIEAFGGIKWLAIAIFSYYEPCERSARDTLISCKVVVLFASVRAA